MWREKRAKFVLAAVHPPRRAHSPKNSASSTLSQANRRVADRPFLVSFGWTLRDYAKRVWDNSGEDNVLFLAGGVAFNIILAAVPFILLVVWGASYLFKV